MHEFSSKPEFCDDIKCLKCCMSEKKIVLIQFLKLQGAHKNSVFENEIF
jgi:hypothetical protein